MQAGQYLCLNNSMLGTLSWFLSTADFFSKSTFIKTSVKNTNRVSNSLDQNQAEHFAGNNLGPNCLQMLSADETAFFKAPIMSILYFLEIKNNSQLFGLLILIY